MVQLLKSVIPAILRLSSGKNIDADLPAFIILLQRVESRGLEVVIVCGYALKSVWLEKSSCWKKYTTFLHQEYYCERLKGVNIKGHQREVLLSDL